MVTLLETNGQNANTKASDEKKISKVRTREREEKKSSHT